MQGRTVIVATHDPDVVAAAAAAVELDRRATSPSTRRGERAGSPSEADPALLVRDVTKRYDGTLALDAVSLELAPGAIGVVLGRSGSGKSTLLMAAGGWLPTDSGTIHLGSEGLGAKAPAWQTLAYLPQRFGLLPELSIAENVGLPLRLAGERDESRLGELLARLELEELAERPPGETSIGQQQRAGLARALVRRPELLLADEPTSHQDAGSLELVWDALSAAREDGTACLIATHEERVAERADRVWELVDGRIETGPAP
jgi:putative ABC transport system ATP-binding protein